MVFWRRYFLIIIGMQILISMLCAGLAFGAVWVTSFANGPVVLYLTVVTGIAFWLKIACIISEIPNISEILINVGRNTYSIMMHHTIVFMVIKGFCYICGRLTPFCKELNRGMFFMI